MVISLERWNVVNVTKRVLAVSQSPDQPKAVSSDLKVGIRKVSPSASDALCVCVCVSVDGAEGLGSVKLVAASDGKELNCGGL